jgi:hypothetical protein
MKDRYWEELIYAFSDYPYGTYDSAARTVHHQTIFESESLEEITMVTPKVIHNIFISNFILLM